MHSQIAPRFCGRSLKEACAEMGPEFGAGGDGKSLPETARREVEARTFRIDERWVGKTVKEVEAMVPPRSKAYVEQLRRDGGIFEVAPDTRFESGDVVCVAGLRGLIVEHAGEIGTEVDQQRGRRQAARRASPLSGGARGLAAPLAARRPADPELPAPRAAEG